VSDDLQAVDYRSQADSGRPLPRVRRFAVAADAPCTARVQGGDLLQGGDQHLVLTVWDSMRDIERLSVSETYLATARALGEIGILTGEQTVRILHPERPDPGDVLAAVRQDASSCLASDRASTDIG